MALCHGAFQKRTLQTQIRFRIIDNFIYLLKLNMAYLDDIYKKVFFTTNVYSYFVNHVLDRARTSNAGALPISNGVGLDHLLSPDSLAGVVRPSEIVVRVGVKVAAETAGSGTVARANGHGGPRARISNVNAQLVGHDPNVRRVELHESELKIINLRLNFNVN